jgi:hypothetical protein
MPGSSRNLSRRDFALALLGVMTLGVSLPQMTGCSLGDAQQQIEDHLRQKYGDIQYTIFNFAPYNAFDHTYNELSAYLPGGDYANDGFDAKLYTDGGTNDFQDSYYGIIIRTQFEAMIQQVADKYFKFSKVFTFYQDFPDDVSATASLTQVLAQGKMAHNDVYLYINSASYISKGSIDKKTFEDDVQAFANAWKSICSASAISGMAITEQGYDNLKKRDDMTYIDNNFNKLILDSKDISFSDWSIDKIPGVR